MFFHFCLRNSIDLGLVEHRLFPTFDGVISTGLFSAVLVCK